MSDQANPEAPQGRESARLDSFLYRHRVADVMRGPVVAVPPDTPLVEASRRMIRERIGSLVVADAEGRPRGIATERDFLRALAEMGPGAADAPISRIMSSPVATTLEDSFLFVAFGRMPRLGIKHLLVVDALGKPVGMISASALMRLRSTDALVIGDEIAAAAGAAALAAVWRRMPGLVGALRAEGIEGLSATAVISSIVREMTARAAELAERSMADAGWGAAPARWCVLVLGSGGRGESALVPDQDNAIIHAGRDSDDAWFAEAGRRIAETLDQAGIPLCKGGVMAKNPAWRRSLADWRQEVERWIRKKEGEELLNVDIFFDFAPVYGDRTLAGELRRHAIEAASRSPLFLRLLAAELDNMHSALGFLGFLRTEQGRFNIKRGGFLPIVTAARVMALKHGVDALGTGERLAELARRNAVNAEDAANMVRAYDFLIQQLLVQQTADVAAGLKPSTRVDPRLLHRALKPALRGALRLADLAAEIARGALSHG
jgi:signal-transduction protein with cAMP-binding, CBS, and nucleotidyltransferase domain